MVSDATNLYERYIYEHFGNSTRWPRSGLKEDEETLWRSTTYRRESRRWDSVDQAEIARRTHRHEPAARRTRTKLKTEMADTRWYSFPAARRAPRFPYSIGLSTSFPTPTRTTQGTAAAPIRSATGYYADNQSH